MDEIYQFAKLYFANFFCFGNSPNIPAIRYISRVCYQYAMMQPNVEVLGKNWWIENLHMKDNFYRVKAVNYTLLYDLICKNPTNTMFCFLHFRVICALLSYSVKPLVLIMNHDSGS